METILPVVEIQSQNLLQKISCSQQDILYSIQENLFKCTLSGLEKVLNTTCAVL